MRCWISPKQHHLLMIRKYPLYGHSWRINLSNNPSSSHFHISLFGPPPLHLLIFFTPSPRLPYPFSLSLFLHPSHLLIPPSFPFFVTQRRIAADLHFKMPSAGSLHLFDSPFPLAVWPSHLSLHLSDAVAFKDSRPRVKGIILSHAPSSMSSLGSDMALHTISILGPGLHEALRILLKVVSGIEEGGLQGLPWQAIPIICSVVKERLALAAISPCLCSSLTVSKTVTLNSESFNTSDNLGRT